MKFGVDMLGDRSAMMWGKTAGINGLIEELPINRVDIAWSEAPVNVCKEI